MPRATVGRKKVQKQETTEEKFDFEDQDANNEEQTSEFEEQIVNKKGMKRPYADDAEDNNYAEPPYDNEVQNMLQSFGADLRKSICGKRKRLETFTQQSMKAANSKVEKMWKTQQSQRQKLNEEYSKQVNTVLDQWDADVSRVKEQEEKLQSLFKQHQKLFQQSRVIMSQRLKTIRQLFEQYSKTMSDLEINHQEHHGRVQGELKKEMSLLQKKILMDTQHQEMANMRKSLQTMLF
ncbi:synaptonemal complex protein 3-like [Anneissia japonica]|uniref:synaptonemal complex protein 3-like n=1 Tax=Anneissia japonica TaxID=1529436 RepID=UPI0014256EB2|nr:synaptonemal complex protein 3-like [Anneissia japonica]